MQRPPAARRASWESRHPIPTALALAVVFVGAALWQAAPAFQGQFLADDQSYIVQNAYVHELSWENLLGILDPWGEPTAYTANYAPVHLLLHAVEYAAFGPDAMSGWHVVNALAHAAASLVLVAFLRSGGLSPVAALFGGAVFLVHPANAETVAWIFQLKTIVALALALGALLLLERRPFLATGLFALALLTKITALFALPVAAAQLWVRGREGSHAWGPLAAWTAIGLGVAILELQAYGVQANPHAPAYPDAGAHARTVVAVAMRYLAMVCTTWGLSTFHQPPPALSWGDPWWLAGLGALALLGWRTAATLRRRDPEAVFWILAAASFAPVSQVFPFLYPMGDRYLYPILPGLIGGTLLALRGPASRLVARLSVQRELVYAAVGVAAVSLLVVLAVRSHGRAPVFRTELTMMVDAALRYPDGLQAHLLRGFRAAQEGDAVGAARSYARAMELGYTNLYALLASPSLAPVRDHPAFRAVVRDLAERTVARIEQREHPSQMELVSLGRAYWAAGQRERAIDAYERALEREGPLAPTIHPVLRQLRGPDGERRDEG